MAQGLETYGIDGLSTLLKEMGQPRFRAKQVLGWVYGRGVMDYEAMTNLPATLRDKLAVVAPLHAPRVVSRQTSADGTRKYLLELADGQMVETVGIPSSRRSDDGSSSQRLTVCFSTQVGCPMRCAFCATGQQGFSRNLWPGEMALQLIVVQNDFGQRVTNAVAMGQGEPFLNFDNLVEGLQLIDSPDAMGIGARHLTVSTCGLPDKIVEFGQLPPQYTLALSLHSAVQGTRDKIMPGCKNIGLPELKEAMRRYYAASHRRASVEYLLIKGVNNTPDEIAALEGFCHGLHVHVNLINLNDVPSSPFKRVSMKKAASVAKRLSDYGIETTVRDSRGSDIDGACGQLKHVIQQDG